MRPRVAVVGGGANAEHDVSLASAAAIADALDPARWQVVRMTIGRDGRWSVGGLRIDFAIAVELVGGCDVVVPAVHGPHGEDGTLAALCELAGVPYVGSGVVAGAIGMDKWATKLVAGAVGISTARGVLLTRSAASSHRWERPVVVKPVAAGSSQGVTLVDRPEAWEPALASALAFGERVLVEEVVHGREIDLAVLGRPDGSRFVAPALEIVVDGIFDGDTKYGGAADFRIPAPVTDDQRTILEESALRMYDALGCAGVARIDFFWTEDGPVLNEVNTMPGFTPASQVPKMFAAAGTAYDELVEMLVRDALVTHARACA